MLNIQTIYTELDSKYSECGRDIISRYPNAAVKIISSHNNVQELNDSALASKWNLIKDSVLVLGTKKGLTFTENGRSSDFIGTSIANGCASACNYCYVARRKGYVNPITIFTNIDEIITAYLEHAEKLGVKKQSNQCDPTKWVYDIGCNNDISIDAMVSNNPKKLIESFANVSNAKLSFATKTVNKDLLNYDHNGNTRIRFSIMPPNIAKVVDIRTSPIIDRLEAVNDFVSAGYEVHLNISPVIIYDNWQNDYKRLLMMVDDILTDEAKDQLACEIIFLTHNVDLHELNLLWHPKGEDLLWKPALQENKTSLMGGDNIRYKYKEKSQYLSLLEGMIDHYNPYMTVRYAF